jgi:hypothetical protein
MAGGAWRKTKTLEDELTDELKRFIRSNGGRPPHIEGPPELQEAVDRLCARIKHNLRGGLSTRRNTRILSPKEQGYEVGPRQLSLTLVDREKGRAS